MSTRLHPPPKIIQLVIQKFYLIALFPIVSITLWARKKKKKKQLISTDEGALSIAPPIRLRQHYCLSNVFTEGPV